MGVDVLLEAVTEGEYDPECARIETALKAIWLLYRRDKWKLLEPYGVSQAEFQMFFVIFEEQYGIHRLRTDRQTVLFLNYLRRVDRRLAIRLLSAALQLIGDYLTRRRRMRAAYYGFYEGEDDVDSFAL